MVSPGTLVEPGSWGSSLTESHHGLGTGQEPYLAPWCINPTAALGLWAILPFPCG